MVAVRPRSLPIVSPAKPILMRSKNEKQTARTKDDQAAEQLVDHRLLATSTAFAISGFSGMADDVSLIIIF
jgi:hypothetical protein